MTDTATEQQRLDRNKSLRKHVHKHGALSKKGMLERMFTFAFNGLVYPQIWEDPLVDQEALQINSDSHIVTIASGGCNVMSYLVDDPKKITALDLNRAHVALNRLKICAAQHLPDYETFYRFFGMADDKANLAAYKKYLQPHLDTASRNYWESRNVFARRRISMFTGNVYRHGLLGKCIGTGHLVARLYGRNPRAMLKANSLQEQRAIFDEVLAPLFDKKMIRWIMNSPVSLYGLGIPPAQYEALAADGDGDMAQVVRTRLEKLACDFSIADNYFANQAFGRTYGTPGDMSLPPYLQKRYYEQVRERAGRVEVRHSSFTDYLRECEDNSRDRYILLDAQDWMTDQDLTSIWTEITRTAKPGARVIFRTAADERLLPGRVPDEILNQWSYDEALCRELSQKDRSSIYGAFHLYVLKD